MISLKVPTYKQIELERLSIGFGAVGTTNVIDDLSLTIAKGEMIALVGESGSGKSLLAHTIAGILNPAARLSCRDFRFSGIDLNDAEGSNFDSVRGREIGIVFQNPRAALNPMRTIGKQLEDVIAEHRGLRRNQLSKAVIDALADVRIPEPAVRANAYPSQLSGGMCQRVMIAIALAGNPALLIADEPTTGLDMTTQAAIMELIVEHARARRMSTLLITHDLALARAYVDRIIVMHAGQIIEDAPAAQLFNAARHPYSQALTRATLVDASRVEDLHDIAGAMPVLDADTPACRFAERCNIKIPRCVSERPPLRGETAEHLSACWERP